jgi:hypothetical protein
VKVALNYWEEVWNGALRDYTKTSAAGLKRNTVTQ